jgi:cell division protein FtsQ
MWDNPGRLNAAAGALALLAAILVLAAAGRWLVAAAPTPLRELAFLERPAHTTRTDIERAVAGYGGSFFAVDLGALRLRLEALPWVRRVEVRRAWPDRIEVRLEEHEPLARWGDSHLVSARGEPFAGSLAPEAAAQLPVLSGPPGTEALVARRYRRFRELLAPLEDAPVRVQLSPRHAWQVQTASGWVLELGRGSGGEDAEALDARLARFAAAYPGTLARLARREGAAPRVVDLRYPNGFALRVPEWRS